MSERNYICWHGRPLSYEYVAAFYPEQAAKKYAELISDNFSPDGEDVDGITVFVSDGDDVTRHDINVEMELTIYANEDYGWELDDQTRMELAELGIVSS